MFRFTIRDLLWLTVVVALAVAWCRDHREMAAYREAVAAKAMAELRWREWKSVGVPNTKRRQAAERHARLRYERDRQAAVRRARHTTAPIALPPPAIAPQGNPQRPVKTSGR